MGLYDFKRSKEDAFGAAEAVYPGLDSNDSHQDADDNLVNSDQVGLGETGEADDAPMDVPTQPPAWTGS